MKNLNLIRFIILILSMCLYPTAHAANVSVHTVSFLPFSLDALYLNEYPFKQSLFNEIEIPAGKYRIQYKHFRNQQMISSNHWVTVKNLPNTQEQQFSLVILPDGEVINVSDFKITSPEMFPEIRFAKRAQNSYRLMQNQQRQRDQFGMILPDVDEAHTTELEDQFGWFTVNADGGRVRTNCTGTFKINPQDALPYFTTANSAIQFNYQQGNKIHNAYLAFSDNNPLIPIEDRTIHEATDYKNGLKFDVYIHHIQKMKTETISSNYSIYNYKVQVKLYMTALQRKPMLLMSQQMYYQDNCSSQDIGSFLYYKTRWSRFWDYILPDISWK